MNQIISTKHKAFNRVFAPKKLSLGLFLPLDIYSGDIGIFNNHTEHIKQIDKHHFAAVWVRDIPLFDPNFGDAGQVYDAFTYLSYLAGQTYNVALGTGSIILPFWHPIALAKTAASIDQLSGNRLLLGVGSGDRLAEFPAFGVDFENRAEKFRQVLDEFHTLTSTTYPQIASSLTQIQGLDLLPKPAQGRIPTLITGSSQQSLSWIATHGDGWITYPGATTSKLQTQALGAKINAWRNLIPNGEFKPHMTNEWIELTEDPNFPRTPLHGGFVLKTGRFGLIDLLNEWQEAGVNHAAIGIQHSNRPIKEIIDELATEVLPHFTSHTA
ncbi:LLM class oxidoreductase [Pedobacter gandavensis]|uniref:LLM class oxidoreductase n=1 Tax=Pedobacter gandavensis TaxID=2679963 RepID=UPI00292DEEE7|nr:LLM class oxidoreductase [Pedobacter gandavensis]